MVTKADRKLYAAFKHGVPMVAYRGRLKYLLLGWFVSHTETLIQYSILRFTYQKITCNTGLCVFTLHNRISNTFLLIQTRKYIQYCVIFLCICYSTLKITR
jgi:hypothetical protein